MDAKPLVWTDWRSQMQHRITTVAQLAEWIEVSAEEAEAIQACAGKYRWSITPYYASLMDHTDASCPIRRQAIPSLSELRPFSTSSVDPVGDMAFRKTNRVVHKYPDRIIMLATDVCPVYCRHCTRKYHTTDVDGTYFGEGASASWEADFAYVAAHPEIRDVLITGGDPLTLTDERLETIIARLRAIAHVEIIRIGSRYPVLLPQRITESLCAMLERYHPVWLNTHFNHPREITEESAAACDRLIRHGVIVQNQSVLLKGINDDPDTMRDLLRGLLKIRVRPYYLYHCDNVTGVSHFATSIETGHAIMGSLLGSFTGFGVPQYVLTTPLGKIPLWSEQLHADAAGELWVENYRGERMAIGGLLAQG
ncbi:MAG: lysine 2,3-aminomutase [Chloroflexota bacterium]|nr:lysine 2,3-aminomutase [Chloroflexota bacterium]